MRNRFRLVLPLVGLALAAGGSADAAGPGIFALTDVRVVRVSGAVIEHGTVVIRDGLIEAVGDKATLPPGTWTIDCKGLTVYPGLVDALSTWGLVNNPAPLAVPGGGRGGRGGGLPTPAPVITTVSGPSTPARGPEDRPFNTSFVKAADQLYPTDNNIEAARNGGFTTAVTFPAGNIFNGQGSAIDLAGDRIGQMVVADAVGQRILLRTSGSRSYPASLMGTIAYIRQIYLDAEHYRLARSIYEKHPQGLQRPAYDRTLEGVLASPRVLLPAVRAVEMERMISLAEELKLNAVIYGGQEAWRETELLSKVKMPVLVSLRFPEKPRDMDPADEESLRLLELREKAPGTAAALAKAGIRFAFYSDGLSNPRDLRKAVKKAIDSGLSPDDALRAMTLSPAEIYGLSDKIGSIDKGKIANLVVADGDLFADSTKIRYIFVDGTMFEPPNGVTTQ